MKELLFAPADKEVVDFDLSLAVALLSELRTRSVEKKVTRVPIEVVIRKPPPEDFNANIQDDRLHTITTEGCAT